MENDVKKREEEVVLQSIEVQMKTGEELLGEVQAIQNIVAANSQDAQELEYGGAGLASSMQSELRRLGLLTREELEQIEAQEKLISTAEGNVTTWIEVTTACLEQRSPELARKFSGSGHFGFGGRLALQPYTLRERLVNLEAKIQECLRRLRSIYEQIKKVGLPAEVTQPSYTKDELRQKPGPTVKTQERARVCKELKDAHPEWTQEELATLFISYSRKDDEFAHRLSDDLRTAGYSVWVDVSGLRGGQEWAREIDKAIRTCDVFVLVISPDSMTSEWVSKETLLAISLKKLIVPIMWRETERPVHLVDIQYVDFQGAYDNAMQELYEALPPAPFPPTSNPPPSSSTPNLPKSKRLPSSC